MKKSIVWLVLLFAFSAGAETGRIYKSYPAPHMDSAEVKAALEEALSPGSRVITLRGIRKVFLIATPEEHELAEALLADLCVPRQNVAIEVRFKSRGRASERGAKIDPSGSVTLGPDGVSDYEIRAGLVFQRTETSSDTVQMLTVMDGRRGRLRIGRSVPYLDWFVQYGRRFGYIEAELKWQEVGAWLVVEPEILPDGLIRVRLIPELSGFVDGSPRQVQFKRVETEVTVAPGSVIRIGGLNKDEEFYSRFLIGGERGDRSEQLEILLTPRIDAGTPVP